MKEDKDNSLARLWADHYYRLWQDSEIQREAVENVIKAAQEVVEVYSKDGGPFLGFTGPLEAKMEALQACVWNMHRLKTPLQREKERGP